MARLGGAPMFNCACSINAAGLGVSLLVGLGLGASCWLALGVARSLPIAGGLVGLLLSLWSPRCLFVPVGLRWRLCDTL